jgi:glycosyltransferase involved in cell wall biosynthesis
LSLSKRSFSQAKNDNSDKNFINLSSIGVIYPLKGQINFLMALDRLLQKGYQNWKANIVGDSIRGIGAPYKSDMISFVKYHNLNEKVHFLGWQNDIDAVFKKTDILVFTSVEFDGFPTVLLEAWQRGIPIVASNIGGVGEIIMEGDNGWLYPPGDVAALTNILIEILEKKRSLSFATPFSFTVERQSEKLYKEYQNILYPFSNPI